MVGRLNGVLRGSLADESFVLSQSFYYGGINGSAPLIRITEGAGLDVCDKLDQVWRGRSGAGQSRGNGHDNESPFDQFDEGLTDEDVLIEAIVSGENYHQSCLSLLGIWAREGVDQAEAEAELRAIFERVPAANRDQRWHDRVGDISRLADFVFGREDAKYDFGSSSGKSGTEIADDWPDPDSLFEPVEPEKPYPIGALPKRIREAVIEYQTYGQQPVPLIACSALSAVSLTTQGLADTRRDEKMSGSIGLYHILVAISGERKTTSDKEFTAAIRQWVRDKIDELRPRMSNACADLAAWAAERDGLLAKIKAASGKPSVNGEADVRALGDALRKLEGNKPSTPIEPLLFYEDTNSAALIVDFAEGWPSASLWSDEAGIVIGSHGMRDETIMSFLGVLNRLWDANDHDRRRVTAPKAKLRGRRFTACLMMQPAVLARLMAVGDGVPRDVGAISRFLLAWPTSTIGTRLYRPPGPQSAMVAFNARLRELLSLPLPVDPDGVMMALRPPELLLSRAGVDAWRAFHDKIEIRLKRGREYGEIKDLGAKAAEQAARMAVGFHVFEHGPEGSIDRDTFGDAARVVEWHLNEARRGLVMTEQPRVVTDAALLLTWLLSRPHPVSLRHILQFGPTPARDKKRRNAAVEYLIERHCARLVTNALILNPKLKCSSV